MTEHGGACVWTIDTLKTHLEMLLVSQETLNEQRFHSLRDANAAAMLAATTAVTKAEVATEKRLEGVNEFRATLADQQRGLIPRSEFDALEKALTFRLDALDRQLEVHRRERLSSVSEQQGMKGGWAGAIAVASFVLTLLTLLVIAAGILRDGAGP